jgi:hypothetical protein
LLAAVNVLALLILFHTLAASHIKLFFALVDIPTSVKLFSSTPIHFYNIPNLTNPTQALLSSLLHRA